MIDEAISAILDDLFNKTPVLAALSGYERDRTREDCRRLIEPIIARLPTGEP